MLQSENRFYREDGFWVVSYDGNESLIQNLDGFAYIQLLLQYKGKKFAYVEIENLLNGEVAKEDGKYEEVHVEPKIMDQGFSLSLTRQDMITKEQLDQALQEKEKVLEKMQAAENIGNERPIQRIKFVFRKNKSVFKDVYLYI